MGARIASACSGVIARMIRAAALRAACPIAGSARSATMRPQDQRLDLLDGKLIGGSMKPGFRR